MKRIKVVALLFVAVACCLQSCNDSESYADQKKKENSAVNHYISTQGIKVISEDTFEENGYKTDVSQNEFVLFKSNGVYMQIIRQGCGEKLKNGERATVLCRFDEYNLMGDSLQLSNNVLSYVSLAEKMDVKNTLGTFDAYFVKGSSLMYSIYGSTSVPGGWLVPLTYINLGRLVTAEDELAKVKLIVPHAQGQVHASQNVYPCMYVLTYQRGL